MFSLYISARPGESFEKWLSEGSWQATLAARRERLEAQIQKIESQLAALPAAQTSAYREACKHRFLSKS
jgi:hypothetical protein